MIIRCIGAMLLWMLANSAHAQTQVRYIHTDMLGSVVAVTDENRNVVERREYEPYGAQLTPAIADGPGYTGHVQDAATGLVYMQQRYYDPGIGAMLSVDPVAAYDNGDMRHFNRYAYAFNNPYRFSDPDGRRPTGHNAPTIEEARQLSGPIGFAADFVPVVGDAKAVVEAIIDPSAANIAAAGVGLVPVVGDVAGKIIKGAAGGERAGKPFTRAGKAEVKADNASVHGGRQTCENCGQETVPAQQSRAGVTPPGNETHVDHVVPRSRGGDGSPNNGQVLCRDCNLKKGDN